MNTRTSILSPEQVVSGIRGGQLLAPLMPSETIIDGYVEQVRSQRMTLRSTDPDTRRLLQLVDGQLLWLKDDIKSTLLDEIEIYCLPLPLSVAYSQIDDERRIIVIGQGMIDLIAYRVCCSHYEALFPEQMATYALAGQRPDMSALEMLSNALMLLGCHFYTSASPLPDVYTPLSPLARDQCERATAGAVLFVLLHELGHLQLGHLEHDEIRPQCVRQVVPEALDSFQLQEHDADQYAAQALVEMAQVLAALWQGSALNFYQQLELITGERSDSHPLAINRRLNADLKKEELGPLHGIASTLGHVQTLAERFLETKTAVETRPNALIATPRDACLKIFREIVEAAYTNHGLDVRASTRNPWNYWHREPASSGTVDLR